LFERAAKLYRELGDVRGEGESLFWVGCFHQVVRQDDDAAVPILEQSYELGSQVGDKRAGTSRVTWEIEPVGDSCRLTVIHDQLPPDAPAELYGGWPMILSGLKRPPHTPAGQDAHGT
jgi:hypothetical protein